MTNFKLTLAILKPDVVGHPVVLKEIKDIILKERFLVVASRTVQMSMAQAENFYSAHKDRFFYKRLIYFMTGGPLTAAILYREGCISKWREVMGPTNVYKTIHEYPNTIRGRFGLSDTRNCTHGSDSKETALLEIATFFPEFDAMKWLQSQDCKLFEEGKVKYNKERFSHEPVM